MGDATIQPVGTTAAADTVRTPAPAPAKPATPAAPKAANDQTQFSGVSKGKADPHATLAGAGNLIEILHTNDTHDHLMPYDKTTKSGNVRHVGGIAQRAAYIQDERKAHPGHTLVVDDGDTFQGTALYTNFKGEPDMKAMAQVHYDIGLLGNHDMDDGWANYKKQMKYANFPILGGNVADANGHALLPTTKIVHRGATTIGVIGLMGDSAWQAVAPKQRANLVESPIIPAAQKAVAAIRNKVDLVVVMTHNGYDQDQELAKAVPGIDVVVGSHSHTPVYKPKLIANTNSNGINGTLVVQAGSNNEYIGNLQLRVQGHTITAYAGQLVDNTADYPVPDKLNQAVKGVVEPYAAKLEARMNTVLGQAPAGGLEKNAFPSPLGTWIAKVTAERTGADIGLTNMHGVRDTMPDGPVTVGSVTGIAPFDNELRRVDIPGSDLLKLVESSKDSHTGVTLSGVEIQGDQVLVKGKPVDPNATYSVGTLDYILDRNIGGTFDHATNTQDNEVLLRDALIDAVKQDPQFHATTTPH